MDTLPCEEALVVIRRHWMHPFIIGLINAATFISFLIHTIFA